jgi:hypothetical protein
MYGQHNYDCAVWIALDVAMPILGIFAGRTGKIHGNSKSIVSNYSRKCII